MKTWVDCQIEVSKGLISFLSTRIESLGKQDWYEKCIKNALSVHAQTHFPSEDEFKYENLQFTDLLRLLEKNLFYFEFDRVKSFQIKNLCHELRDVRNRYAHDGINGIKDRDFLRDIDSFSVKTDAVLKTYRLFMEIDT